jgi:hypothetical protein
MKKLIALLFVAFLALGLVACAKDEPSYEYGYGVGYGLVHGHYVGVAKVVLDKDDKVVNVQFDEYYLPYNAGQVVYTPVEGVAQPADILTVVGSRGTSYFAKYFSVNGVLFTGTVTGESGAQSIVYGASGITNIETWVETEANAKAYVEAVEAGLVFIANANGTKSTYEFGNASVKRGWTKSATAYWANAATYPLGWGGNMAAIAEAMVGTKLDAAEADLVKDGTWKIGTIVTGATLSDFVDYYQLAQRAYANALAGKK